jgi:shikimate kinase
MAAFMLYSKDAPILLIGYRATGKSLVARELASRLGFKSIDADDVIEQWAGKSIALIFVEDGEAAFRELEAQVVATLVKESRTVVALGGGAVLRTENREAIRAAGPVVWLRANVDTILERMTADSATASRRPNLTEAGGRAEVTELLAARTPLYQECATLTVETDGKSAAEIVREIIAKLDAETVNSR